MFAALLFAVIVGTNAGPVALGPRNVEPTWDILKLTQTWPPAGCIFIENDHKQCQFPSETVSWVVHGLWPTKRGTEEPNFCNSSWHFNSSEIQKLRPTLDYNWPSLALHEIPEDTWRHEWEKHGTCATILPTLKNEFAYFNVTLGLHFHFDLGKMLNSHGIIPSNVSQYQPGDILTALKDSLGVYPSITCVKEKDTEKFYIEEVEICLDKSLQLVDCDASGSTAELPPSASSGNALLFNPEPVLRKQTIRKYIIDCPADDGVYYKPFSK